MHACRPLAPRTPHRRSSQGSGLRLAPARQSSRALSELTPTEAPSQASTFSQSQSVLSISVPLTAPVLPESSARSKAAAKPSSSSRPQPAAGLAPFGGPSGGQLGLPAQLGDPFSDSSAGMLLADVCCRSAWSGHLLLNTSLCADSSKLQAFRPAYAAPLPLDEADRQAAVSTILEPCLDTDPVLESLCELVKRLLKTNLAGAQLSCCVCLCWVSGRADRQCGAGVTILDKDQHRSAPSSAVLPACQVK